MLDFIGKRSHVKFRITFPRIRVIPLLTNLIRLETAGNPYHEQHLRERTIGKLDGNLIPNLTIHSFRIGPGRTEAQLI